MKKLTLLCFSLLLLTLGGCSNNDDAATPANSFTVNVNGVEKVYNQFYNRQHTDGTIQVSAFKQNPEESITFYYSPQNGLVVFSYQIPNNGYGYTASSTPEPFIITLHANNSEANRLSGSFSGRLASQLDQSEAVFTNGEFDIEY